jgi:cyclophilin family peptidyl-prolyl cis-trans isomerase
MSEVSPVIRKLFSRRSRSSSVSSAAPRSAPRSALEPLEGRVLLHNTFITDVRADNRGEVLVFFEPGASEVPVDQFNKQSVQMWTNGPDGHAKTADDVRVPTSIRFNQSNQRLLIRGHNVAPGEGYRIRIVSGRISYASGFRMDGDFNGTFPTGDGVHAGNFEMQVKNDRSATPLMQMSTSQGVMNLTMRGDVAPATVRNFLTYANDGDFDNAFFTRSEPGFVIQGGSLQINDQNEVVEGQLRPPVVNEFNISNTRGTMAMARQGGVVNSATNQFFFNLGDNSSLDTVDEGFTVFAEVAGDNGLATMDAIAALQRVDLSSQIGPFAATGVSTVPVEDPAAATSLDPFDHLVVIRRVATQMRIATV